MEWEAGSFQSGSMCLQQRWGTRSGRCGNWTDSGRVITSQPRQLRNRMQTQSKAMHSPIIPAGSRDVLCQVKEEVWFSAKIFSFPCRYAPITSVPSPAFSRSPQFLWVVPSHHEILQQEAEEGVSYSSYLSTKPQISEMWVGAARRSFWQGALALKHVPYIMNILQSAKWSWPWIGVLEELGRCKQSQKLFWPPQFFVQKTKQRQLPA